MASKINKKYTTDVRGILSIDSDQKMTVEVEDITDPVDLAELFSDFENKDVKITIAYAEEL